MRIRTIKPAFFTDDHLAELPPLTRLLFIGLWTLADREGRLEDRPKRIKVQLLPFDEADIDAMLAALHDARYIVRYAVEGIHLIQVRTFSKHQRISGKEAAGKSEYPPMLPSEVNGKHPGSIREASETAGREGKGKEGKGRERIPPAAPSERGVKFAEWFKTLLPDDSQVAPSWRTKWAQCFDEMLRLDHRSPDQIAKVCEWARKDGFWSSNFLTPLKLRERKNGVQYFDTFAERMKSDKAGGKTSEPENQRTYTETTL